MTASRAFQVMAKPGGPICNLACRYCYYLGKEHLYPRGEVFRMPDDLLERYIAQHIEATTGSVVSFEWHGGEPTILGLDFFRRIVALQRRHRPPDREIVNGVQTNGTLLDEAWCRFFAEEGFVVGLSLDGPAEVHDRHRVTKGERPTHREVVRAWRLLQRHRVRTDPLCVVHADSARLPLAVYRFFKDLGARTLQFLPLVEALPGGGVSARTVAPEAWGEFLCAVFDEWVRQDVGRVTVQIFDEALRTVCGVAHALCVFRETCGMVPVVEHDGGVFACDHFVDPAHRLGSLREATLAELLEHPALHAFGLAKRDALPGCCRACDVRAFCHGGCPKDRFAAAPDGEAGLNYLCSGYRRFFAHARPYLAELAALWRAGRPLNTLMHRLRAAETAAQPRAGRNDPCPCGSGLKFKRCCLGRSGPRPGAP